AVWAEAAVANSSAAARAAAVRGACMPFLGGKQSPSQPPDRRRADAPPPCPSLRTAREPAKRAATMSKIETPRPIRGTQDIFGAEAEAFAHVVETFERVRKLYRFRRVEMPVFEKTEVFSRSLGETTDVVSKEMYSFEDRGGESLTLRPEFTAGIARAYLT